MSRDKFVSRRKVRKSIYLVPCPKCGAGVKRHCFYVSKNTSKQHWSQPHAERIRTSNTQQMVLGEELMRLFEFTKEEWRDIVRQVKPGLSDEEFDVKWEVFAEIKRKKELQ